MNSSKNVVCPICNKAFSPSKINSHVDRCLNSSDKEPETDDMDPPSKKRKCSAVSSSGSGWGFLMSNEKHKNGNMNSKKSNKDTQSDSSVMKIGDSNTECITIDSLSDDGQSTGANQEKHNEPSAGMNIESKKKPKQSHSIDFSVPLADQMRPESLDSYIGQEKAVGKDKMMWSLLQSDSVPSMILWGPPGCGKTTLAKIVARKCKGKMKFVTLSATSSGVNDVKDVVKKAKNDLKMFRKRTILFLDEIHRFNKLQQDSLLPHVEDGTITLIGATTENPSFQVNTALLSRSRVVVLDKLCKSSIMNILLRTVEKINVKVIEEAEKGDEEELDRVCIESTALNYLSSVCDGDARAALNGLQMTLQSEIARSELSDGEMRKLGENTEELHPVLITTEHVKAGLQRSHVAYDKTGEEHYNMISALHKSMRGSCDSAALYWLARMMEGGEDPLYIARRLIEFSSEDVGLADPQALTLAVSTFQACHFIGKPECAKPLAECVVYLSRAPKSIEAVSAYMKAKTCIHDHDGPLPVVPLHLRNASNKFMSNLGYGKGYRYQASSNNSVKQKYLPDELIGTDFFK